MKSFMILLILAISFSGCYKKSIAADEGTISNDKPVIEFEWTDDAVGSENDISIIDFNPVELVLDWKNWKGEISKDNGKTWKPACFVKGDRLRIWVEE